MSAPELRTPGPVESGSRLPSTAGHRVRDVLAELFPAPAEREGRSGLARGGFVLAQIAVVALGALLMLARISGRPAWDTVYAEDPGVYLPQALAHPWQLLQSYGGYLQLFPRLIAQVAALAPVRDASYVFAVSGAAIASACGLFTYHASGGLIGSRWLRGLLGLSVVLLPVAQLEIADNGVNCIWYLLAALFWAALWRPRTPAGGVIAAVVAFAAVTSTSLGLVFGLLFVIRAVVVPRRLREHAATAGWAAGALLQVVVMLTSHVSRLVPRNPVNAVLYYLHEVLLPALGWHLSWHLRQDLGLTAATALAIGFFVVVFGAAVITLGRRCRVFVSTAVLTGVLFTVVTSILAWGGPGQRVTIAVEHGARYSTLPILLLDAALIVAVDACAQRWAPSPKAMVAVVVLTAVLAVGWVTDFRYPVRRLAGRAADWQLISSTWLRHCERDPAGTLTVTFPNWWGTVKVPLATTFSCSSLRR